MKRSVVCQNYLANQESRLLFLHLDSGHEFSVPHVNNLLFLKEKVDKKELIFKDKQEVIDYFGKNVSLKKIILFENGRILGLQMYNKNEFPSEIWQKISNVILPLREKVKYLQGYENLVNALVIFRPDSMGVVFVSADGFNIDFLKNLAKAFPKSQKKLERLYVYSEDLKAFFINSNDKIKIHNVDNFGSISKKELQNLVSF